MHTTQRTIERKKAHAKDNHNNDDEIEYKVQAYNRRRSSSNKRNKCSKKNEIDEKNPICNAKLRSYYLR